MNTESPPPPAEHPVDWYLDHLRTDVDRFADVLTAGPTDAPVAACPGWDVARLAVHLGGIHRWARQAAEHAEQPGDAARAEPAPDTDLADWLRTGVHELADTLRALDPDAPTWHPFPPDQVPLVARVWARRQAHETAMHRWDAEHAVGRAPTLDPELASDGIDEYFALVVPRLVVRKAIELPEGSLHVHCTDVAGEWLVWNDPNDGYQLVRAHQKGDAALRGPAAALLLRLWGRTDDGAGDELSPVGDDAVLAAWLSIAGM